VLILILRLFYGWLGFGLLRAVVVIELGLGLLVVDVRLVEQLVKDVVLAFKIELGVLVDIEEHQFAEPFLFLEVTENLVVILDSEEVSRAFRQKAFRDQTPAVGSISEPLQSLGKDVELTVSQGVRAADLPSFDHVGGNSSAGQVLVAMLDFV